MPASGPGTSERSALNRILPPFKAGSMHCRGMGMPGMAGAAKVRETLRSCEPNFTWHVCAAVRGRPPSSDDGHEKAGRGPRVVCRFEQIRAVWCMRWRVRVHRRRLHLSSVEPALADELLIASRIPPKFGAPGPPPIPVKSARGGGEGHFRQMPVVRV